MSDAVYLVRARFADREEIWRGGVFDTADTAVAEWDRFFDDVGGDIALIEVLELKVYPTGHITIDRLNPRT